MTFSLNTGEDLFLSKSGLPADGWLTSLRLAYLPAAPEAASDHRLDTEGAEREIC